MRSLKRGEYAFEADDASDIPGAEVDTENFRRESSFDDNSGKGGEEE